MNRSVELQSLIAELHNPNIHSDPALEVEVDPATRAVKSLEIPSEMEIFLKAYIKGMIKYEFGEVRRVEGLISSLAQRKQVKASATNNAVSYVLTKAIDSSPSHWHVKTWVNVAEQSGCWPIQDLNTLETYSEDDLYDNFIDF